MNDVKTKTKQMVVYQILFSAGRLRKIKFNISKNNFIRSGEWGNTL